MTPEQLANTAAQAVLDRHGLKPQYTKETPLTQFQWELSLGNLPHKRALIEYAQEAQRITKEENA